MKLTTNKTYLKSNLDKSKEIIQIQHKVSGMGNIKKKLIDMKKNNKVCVTCKESDTNEKTEQL